MSTSDPSLRSSPRTPTAGFPIAALVLLITTCACLLVSADIHRLREQYEALSANGSWCFVTLTGTAALIGGLVGVVTLLRSRASWRIRLLAIPAGILAAETALLILLAPGPVWRTIFAVTVLLGAAILFRLDAD
jgi:hypothetical protein